MIPGIALLLGLVVGSFLNVVIVRLPLGGSIVSPPSHCPRCSVPIRWYDNIPVLSYLALRGRCRSCGAPISLQYPAVELANGLLWLWTAAVYDATGEAIIIMALCSCLLVITLIDLDHFIIPDAITLPGMAAGMLLAPFFLSALQEQPPFRLGEHLGIGSGYLAALLNSVIGLLAGGGPLWTLAWTWEHLRKVEALGGGDVKLMGMVGSFLGWQGAFLTILLGAMTGSVIGLTLIALKRHQADRHLPFGPFLAFGALLAIFFSVEIREWYIGLFLL